MTQQPRFAGVKGDECQCGRRATVRHCPRCGSTRLYAYSTPQYHEMLNGERKLVESLTRCLSCAHKFEESEREFCDAPPFGPVLAAQKVKALHEASKTGEYLRPAEQEAAKAINEMLGAQPNAMQPSDGQIRTLEKQFRLDFVKAKLTAKQNGQQFSESLNDFIVRKFREMGFDESLIERMKKISAYYENLVKEANATTEAQS